MCLQVWTSGIKVAPDTIFQLWKSPTAAEMTAIVEAGYRAIISDSDKWYMNCGMRMSVPACRLFPRLDCVAG